MVGLFGVVLFGLSENISTLSVSIFLIGVWDMMTGTLTLDRLGQLCNEDSQRRAWSVATSVGALGFITFSSVTSQLSDHHLNLILLLGVAAVVIQFALECTQYLMSSSHQSQLMSD